MMSMKNILAKIAKISEDGFAIPLIVSEGSKEQKLSTIYGSAYLRTIYEEVLSKLNKSVAIYGWAMNEDLDGHIIEAISKNDVKRVAISVYPDGGRLDARMADYTAKIQKNFSPETKIFFFNAKSCWVYSQP